MLVPPDIDFATAASLPCPALTAWLALEKLPTRAGARVLISGAGGAVGLYALQVALMRGFRVSVMCHPRHWERLTALGAIECFEGPLGADPQWPVRHAGAFYAVIDCVNADHAMRLAPVLSASGHLVCIQSRVDTWPCTPFGRTLSIHEVALGALHDHGSDLDWAPRRCRRADPKPRSEWPIRRGRAVQRDVRASAASARRPQTSRVHRQIYRDARANAAHSFLRGSHDSAFQPFRAQGRHAA